MWLQLLTLSTLITWAVVEVVNHGEILRPLVDRLYGWSEGCENPVLRFLLTPLRALGCPYCFSHWAALGASFATVCPAGADWWWAFILWLPATRLANLANDLTAGVCRTPGRQGLNKRLADAKPEELEKRLIALLGDAYDPTRIDGGPAEKD